MAFGGGLAGVSAAAAAAVLLLVGIPATGGGAAADQAKAQRAQVHRPAQAAVAAASHHMRTAASIATTAATATTAARAVDLRITAHGRGSWVEVRRGSKSGKLLYVGVLGDGRRLHFHGLRLWTSLGAAGNLTIVANGKLVALDGTFEKVFAAGR